MNTDAQASGFSWLLAFALFASGCGGAGSPLIGTWSSEISADHQLASEASPLDARSADPSDRASTGYSIRLQFYRNGRLDTVTQLPNIQTQKSGRWRWIAFDPATRMATIECELMQQRTQHQVEFVDPQTIRLVPPNMAGLKLQLEFKKD
jgi:hypothetical protein